MVMFVVMIFFSAFTYVVTGSLSDTIFKTVIVGVLLQMVYFVAIAVLVARETRHRRQQKGDMRRSWDKINKNDAV
ncbi:exopolysaccharide production repressor protein [Allorhizobium sp. BGMRC 0089]|uniref:exopolysaccharide production repressor protein n=1 Tax=Allorhizobium sonneratiae TaxID=2934936 RepID=UPI0020339820|nr:exopolysaccharide production repressor protein [Allorhizobium sonneratiae]MCM2291768.1 exopolysaccharide production repressor protein [Allorhizobium sonneratiae]